MKRFAKLASWVLVAGAAVTGQAMADDAVTGLQPFFNVGPSYTFADQNDRQSDDGVGYFVGFGVPLLQNLAIEALYEHTSYQRGGAPTNYKWHENGGEVNALVPFPLSSGWIPYLSAGGTLVHSFLGGSGSSSDWGYSAGAGVFKFFTVAEHDFGIRLEARYRHLNISQADIGNGFAANGNFDDTIVRIGVLIPLGKSKAAPVAAAPEGDADGDGVVDSKDKCPDTPKGVKVDATGCPLATNVGGPAKPLKSLGPVYFDFDKADLKAAERAKLDNALKIVDGMKKPKIIIKLDGHTDDVGTPEYNTGLGERRAQAVKKYLSSKGYKGAMEVNSYGESKPVADNGTEQGRALNRRVEVLVVEE